MRTHLKPYLLGIALLICSGSSPLVAQDYLHSLQTIEQYNALKGSPPNPKYGQVGSLKVIWEIKHDKLYFINSEKFEWHYDFAHAELGYWQNKSWFLSTNYADSPKREYVLANLNHYEASGFWTIEFSPADEIPSEFIELFMERVGDSVKVGKGPALFLNTIRLEDLYAGKYTPFKVLRPDDIYTNLVYQPLVEGEAYGYLRKIKVEDLKDKYPGVRDIVVLNGTPLDIPPTAGVITSEFQTPLSHINVLCQNRGTPIIAQKGIFDDPLIDSLEWDLVHFQVYRDSFVLEKASIDQARIFWADQAPKRNIKLKRDLNRKELIPIDRINANMVNIVGGKAANFGTLARIAKRSKGGFKVPEGAFAIPFFWYQQHLERSGADSLVSMVLNDPSLRSNPMELDNALKAIRDRIKKYPLDTALVRRVYDQVALNPDFRRMRFRSSTNAEDIDGFNGAGLYTSKTGWVTDTAKDKTVEKAIRKVWASVWNFRAFQEREYFGIPQEQVAMGILVHRSFPNESANGVAITKNLYRKSYYGFVINVQKGEVSVVSPPDNVICDQLICYSDTRIDFFTDKAIVEYLSHSSLTAGQSVMTRAQVTHLTGELARIKEHYFYNVRGIKKPLDYKDFALDIEFKIDGPQDQLYIKQVRVYND